MTDPTIITDKLGTLTVRTVAAGDRISLVITHPANGSILGLTVTTAALLAAIDANDPDAMRAYLRETAPEADSPEDVDERPGRDDPTERAQIDRAWAMEHAAAVLGRLVAATGAESGELPVTGYASWLLTGSTETLDR